MSWFYLDKVAIANVLTFPFGKDNFSCRLLPQPTEHSEDEESDRTRLNLEMHLAVCDALCLGEASDL